VGVGGVAWLFGTQRGSQTLHWAAMPRLRLGNARRAFTIGVGASGGNYAHGAGSGECYFVCTDPPPVQYTYWGNAELGGEILSGRGGRFAFRAFVGVAHGWTHRVAIDGFDAPTIPYTGIGWGMAF
jgi:hypothetical protein